MKDREMEPQTWQIAKAAQSNRPHLSRSVLTGLSVATLLAVAFAIFIGRELRPGDPLGQTSAIVGSLLLLMPLVFTLAKRGGKAVSPPFWFALHVVSGYIGIALIALHVASVSDISPALIPLGTLIALVMQGFWLRVVLSPRLSFLFARSQRSFDYGKRLETNKHAIAALIAKKEQLLITLDPLAEEATFSPNLRHWLQAPLKSISYEILAHKEARLVGAKARAGFLLAYSRRFHMTLALLFFVSLFAHIIVMTFFAGYAANGAEIYWWHIADWGQGSR